MIVKNESRVIERCLSSVKDLIDCWVIVDTGSNDGTQNKIRQCLQGIPGELIERPWVDFAHNRNEALKFAEKKADYILFIDADEILRTPPGYSFPKLTKDYYVAALQRQGIECQSISLIKSSCGWLWQGILHEEVSSPRAKSYERLQGVVKICDREEGFRSLDPQKYQKDLQILQRLHQEDPNNARTVSYLAETHFVLGQFEEALRYYQLRTTMGGRDEDVFWALYTSGKCLAALQKDPLPAYRAAFLFRPCRAEPLFQIGEQYRLKNDLLAAYFTLRFALSLPKPQDPLFLEHWIYDYGLDFALARISWELGKYEESGALCEKILAQSKAPEDIRNMVANNLSLLRRKTVAIFTWDCNGGVPWDPDSIHQGITGSEEAVVYMSKELAALGLTVTVFGNPPPGSKYMEANANPRFLPYAADDGRRFDFAISWRMANIGKDLRSRAKKVYFWPHDRCTVVLNEEEIDAFDGVLWLSEWQREGWVVANPRFAKHRSIFGNGIDPNTFPQIHPRKNPYSCIYGSNYGQGLELLLDVWPEVKRRFPAASLDIYYGWQHWGFLTPEKEARLRKIIPAMASMDVREHGLVSHAELNKAYGEASLWTYPCIGTETFSITALRAQFAGAIPVVIKGSGLNETVRNGYQCSSKEEYLTLLLKALEQSSQATLADRKQMSQFIREGFTWEAVAKKWKRYFEDECCKQGKKMF